MDIHKLKPILDRLMQADDQWNFDLEDCDQILRVETRSTSSSTIINELKNVGYLCEELEDLIPLPVAVIRSIEPDQSQGEKSICGH